MKYYEVLEPYYGLIKAPDEEITQEMFWQVVSDEGKVEEVDRDYALVKFCMSFEGNNKMSIIQEILKEFQSDESLVLLVDGGLL